MKFVSFYTRNYAEVAKRLIASMERFGLDYDIHEVPCLGNWSLNNYEKAHACLEASRKHGKFAWVDADAEFLADPRPAIEEIASSCDFAAHQFRGFELISSFMVFGDGKRSKHLIDRWYWSLRKGSFESDRDALASQLQATRDLEFRFWPLGPEWCYIDDLSRWFYPQPEPIIVYQHQHSRKRSKWETSQ